MRVVRHLNTASEQDLDLIPPFPLTNKLFRLFIFLVRTVVYIIEFSERLSEACSQYM